MIHEFEWNAPGPAEPRFSPGDYTTLSEKNKAPHRVGLQTDNESIDSASIKRRILVVDDEDSIRILLSRFLARAGFEVDSAEDGAVAIERMQESDYDAVVSDLMMPHVDGFSLLAFIEKERPHLLPRTIVLTAYSRLAEERLNPACSLVEKPFDLEKMLAMIRSFFDSQPQG
ncbi:MAG TPA: response regulator [Thermoanaerobaculia bacterium]|nr:response regulator [Thermoanaerobaculia bacterium]